MFYVIIVLSAVILVQSIIFGKLISDLTDRLMSLNDTLAKYKLDKMPVKMLNHEKQPNINNKREEAEASVVYEE